MSPGIDERVPGRIITFYSYKGGTGRSMALANIAFLLARGLAGDPAQTATRARRVLMIDWDLEAPGLERVEAGRRVCVGRADPELREERARLPHPGGD